MSNVDPFTTHLAYAIYLSISVGLTVWVARTLSRSGRSFLIRCFGQDEELADSTNRLLVIGFYLINLGFICLRLGEWRPLPEIAFSQIGTRIGVTLLVLGGMHFFNMLMIARMGRTVSTWVAENRVASESDAGAGDYRSLR